MATPKTTTPKNRKHSTCAPSRPRRASQRITSTISIDLHERSLRDLMIEQCKDGDDFITVYRGSHAQLLKAGVPQAAFPAGADTVAQFKFHSAGACSTGSQEIMSASMRSTDAGFELEVEWGTIMPYSCAHPAISELARMLLIDLHYWTDDINTIGGPPNLAYPIEAVIDSERATDYKPRPGTPRVQLTPEFHKSLKAEVRHLFDFVHAYGEVVPVVAEKDVRHVPGSKLRLVADNGAAVKP